MSKIETYRRKQNLYSKVKTGIAITAAAAILTSGLLTVDYLTKRNNYPERDVIFRATQQVELIGGEEKQDENSIDRKEDITIYAGNVEGAITKQQDILATSERIVNDDQVTYHLKNNVNNRVANGVVRDEKVQSGLSISGAWNYREQIGYFPKDREVNPFENPNEDAFIILRIEPERGLNEVEINFLRQEGKLHLKTRLVEGRSVGLGWLYGKNYRSGTTLEKYTSSEEDPKVKELVSLITGYNTRKVSMDNSERVKTIEEILKTESEIPRAPIYHSFEDGFIKWNFQESSIYIGHQPKLVDRMGIEVVDFLEQAKRVATLGLLKKNVDFNGFIRVENHYDFFPGNIPILNKLRYDNGSNRIFSLFDKTNNGGYEIIDQFGTIGKIVIEDFWLHYDNDLVYKYYLDKNGDGKIDEESECIGEVLVRSTFGQKEENAGQVIGKDMPKRNITYNYQYSFMAGNLKNPEERYKDFLLCAYMESLMPDQLNRGYGKHSKIGFVNEARSDIVLFNHRQMENLSRALTDVNTLVADSDIYNILKATKRPYADDFGRAVGLLK